MNQIIKFIIILHGIREFLSALGSIFIHFFGFPKSSFNRPVSRACENECSMLGYLVRVPKSSHHQSREETSQSIGHFSELVIERDTRGPHACLEPSHKPPRAGEWRCAAVSSSPHLRCPLRRRHRCPSPPSLSGPFVVHHLVRLQTIIYPLVSTPGSN